MKKTVLYLGLWLSLASGMSSCYSLTYAVGEGPQRGIEVKEKNHFFVYGLAKGKTSDPVKMAGEAEDYQVNISHSFVDGLVSMLTLGIYNPTTTKVTK